MNNKNIKTIKIVQSAIFCALIFVCTMVQVPAPTVGNINLGDCMIIFASCSMGGVYCIIASALGGALSDLLSGYVIYSPATLVIKALMALTIVLMLKLVFKKTNNLSVIRSSICAEAVMILGYFLYEATILGYGFGAAANISFNAIQGGINIAVGVILYNIANKIGLIKKLKNS